MTRHDWKAFGTLALITAVVAFADAATFGGHTGQLGTLGIAAEACYIVLPGVGAAWVLTTNRLEPGDMVRVILVVMALMAAIDLLPTGGPERASGELILDSSQTAEFAAPPPRWTAGGAWATVLACLSRGGCLGGSPERLNASSQRFAEVLAIYKLAYLMAPLVVVALTQWLYVWAVGSLAFLKASARHVVVGLTTWATPAVAVYLTLAFASQGLTAALVSGLSPIAILGAYLPLIGLAGLAWLTTPREPAR